MSASDRRQFDAIAFQSFGSARSCQGSGTSSIRRYFLSIGSVPVKTKMLAESRGVGAILKTDGPALHAIEGSRGCHSHAHSVDDAFLRLQILVGERLAEASHDVEAQAVVGRTVLDCRVVAGPDAGGQGV